MKVFKLREDIRLYRDESMTEELLFVKALLRRFLTKLIPQRYHAEIQDTLVCTYKQNFNPFVLKLIVDFSADPQSILDRRMGIAGAVLLGAIEGRQQ